MSRRTVTAVVALSASLATLLSPASSVVAARAGAPAALLQRTPDSPAAAGPFNKTAPANGAVNVPRSATFSWGASAPSLTAGAALASHLEIEPAAEAPLYASFADSMTRTGVADARRRLLDSPQTVSIIVSYTGFPPAAQSAFQFAVNIWQTMITSNVPITVNASWTPLAGGVLGTVSPNYRTRQFAGAPTDAWYAAALANKLAGVDLQGTHDINASFNSSLANWYFGTDGNTPAGQFDMVTAVLGELAHGLGFLGFGNVSNGVGSVRLFGVSYIYDRFVEFGADNSIVNTSLFPDPSAAMASALQSNDLWFDGPQANAANGGARPKLHAPNPFVVGSSYSHLDEAAYPAGHPNSLMTPTLGMAESIFTPGAALGILGDIGWTTSSPAPTVTYEFCLDLVANSVCDSSWTPMGSQTTTTVNGLRAGATYYWQVRATASNGGGAVEANGGTWFTFRVDDGATPGDFNGNGSADVAVYRNGAWFILGQPTRNLGLAGDVPVPGDYDGDGDVEAAVFRPSTGEWFVEGQPVVQFGLSGDVPVPADYNGDGATDIAVFRTSGSSGGATWHVRGGSTFSFGARGDIPVPGKVDKDGLADLVVYRPASSQFWMRRTSDGGIASVTFGAVGDVPVPGDFDGDDQLDFALYRNGQWWIVKSSTAYNTGAAENHAWGLPGDVPMLMDLNGDEQDDLVVFRPSDCTYHVFDPGVGPILDVQHGLPGDIPAAQRPRIASTAVSDFDGDGKSDATVFRAAMGQWFTRLSTTNYTTYAVQQWGVASDVAVPGDYDGDRRADVAVFRPSIGYWFLRLSSTNFTTYRQEQWGIPGDVPVPADYDGDGRTDIAVFRSGSWYVRTSSTNYASFFQANWGAAGDTPLPGDYDGDGKAELAVYRLATNQWFLRLTGVGFGSSITKWFGVPGDVPAASDFDGDGRTDIGIFRPSQGRWYTVDAVSSFSAFGSIQWGVPGDVPDAHDYDGDRRSDAAIFRPSTGEWYVLRSSTGTYFQLVWGVSGDQPLLRAR